MFEFVECGDLSPHGSESGDKSPHSTLGGLNDDQGCGVSLHCARHSIGEQQ